MCEGGPSEVQKCHWCALVLCTSMALVGFFSVAVFSPHVFRPKLDVILRLEHERAVLVGSILGGLFIFSFCLSGFIYYLKETKKT